MWILIQFIKSCRQEGLSPRTKEYGSPARVTCSSSASVGFHIFSTDLENSSWCEFLASRYLWLRDRIQSPLLCAHKWWCCHLNEDMSHSECTCIPSRLTHHRYLWVAQQTPHPILPITTFKIWVFLYLKSHFGVDGLRNAPSLGSREEHVLSSTTVSQLRLLVSVESEVCKWS